MSVPDARGAKAAWDAASSARLRVTEFTDAACPWAWGSEPTFRLLHQTLDGHVDWHTVFGILFDEDDDPAPDPTAEARWYEDFIRRVTEHTHAPYARRLERLTRSSWPAAQVAKAAGQEGSWVFRRVLRRLREATFVRGIPADDDASIREALAGVEGVDLSALLARATSPTTVAAVRADHVATRRPLPAVFGITDEGPHPGGAKELEDGHRYALPTLLFEGPGGTVCVPGYRPAPTYLAAAARAGGFDALSPVLLTPRTALAHWRSLTGPEWTTLTTTGVAPREAVRVVTENGPVWLHPEEARVHPAGMHGH